MSLSWTSQYLTSNFVAIDYTYDNGATWVPVATVAPNNGSYTWTTPNTPSTQCKVRVSEYQNSVVNDKSDVNFTIALPSITVTLPNGGEQWKGCTTQTISWTAAGTSGTYRVYYSLNNGASWTSINTTTSTSLSWSPIVDSPTSQARIKVVDNNVPTTLDSSNRRTNR